MAPLSTIADSPPRPVGAIRELRINLLAVVVLAALLIPLSRALQPPEFLDRLTIENHTEYDLSIKLRDSVDGPVLGLGVTTAGSTKEVKSVLDPGDTFVFEFSYGGVPAERAIVDRSTLEESGWRIAVPAAAAAALRDAGLPPPP